MRRSHHIGSVGSISNIRNVRGCIVKGPIRGSVATSNSNLILPSGRELSQLIRSMNFESDDSDSVPRSEDFQHWFKNWQGLRKNKLTASTFAGAIGFWPRRRKQLWLEKIGLSEPFSGNLATSWNNFKEEEAIERYKIITGNEVLFPEFQVHGMYNPEDIWLAASPDGVVDEIVYGLPTRGVLEIKCPYTIVEWKRIPLYFIPQSQGLMEILDRDWMDFYVWTLKGSCLFRVFRNKEYWDLLKIALSDFWWKHVQPAKEMCRRHVITDPPHDLKLLRPAPRHALYYDIICESKGIADNSKLLLRESNWKIQD